MPYSKPSEAPAYVPDDKRAQWIAVWNSAYKRALKDGKSKDDAEASAFAQANGVAGPNSKAAGGTTMANVNYQAKATGKDHCEECEYFSTTTGVCTNQVVADDPNVPENSKGQKLVEPQGWCNQFEALVETLPTPVPEVKAVKSKLSKFIPFAKVDAKLRQVWGIVTAELPDKDDEVCDYAKSKPFYMDVIAEMDKATNGQNFFPLRAMHQLSAVGKCIGFDFRDADREIFMGFEVVDDAEWKKVEKNVYTGFSQGGSIVGPMEADPVFKGCMRYVAKPSECSLVDNPCLAAAHFAFIRTDGAVEMRKFRHTEAPDAGRLATLEEEVKLLKARLPEPQGIEAVSKAGKTKRVGGKDLPSSAFAYVGDSEKTETWKLPIHDAAHARNALARFNQTQGIPAGEKSKVHARIVAAAKKFGIDVASEKSKLAAIHAYLRKAIRISINRLAKTKDPGRALAFVDNDLAKLAKGMYNVGRLACFVEELGYMVYNTIAEEEWEEDTDSPLPTMLADNVHELLDTLVQMVQEESSELREEVDARLSV